MTSTGTVLAERSYDWIDGMAWAAPQYSNEEVDKAGSLLIKGEPTIDELESAFTIINNWRSSHGYPFKYISSHATLQGEASIVQ